MRRILTTLAATAVLILAGQGAASPAAAATCATAPSRANCDGQDPMVTGCADDAVTIHRATTYLRNAAGTPLARVELRWSPRCQTNWVRATALNSSTRDMQVALWRCDTNVAAQCRATGSVDTIADFFPGGRVKAPTVWSAMGHAPDVCAFGQLWLYFANGVDWKTQITGKACA
jgi:hypothetical protein